jgi:glyoxylase-like metal-dependent hydrolase (beta-lactamase superfamily II)
MRFTVGNIRITQVRESLGAIPAAGLFPDADPALLEANRDWLQPHYMNADGTLALSIHALVVESMGKTIVVDTCVGERPVPGYDAMSNRKTTFLADFAAVGFDVNDVDVVMCTHLHFDHVGWNTRLEGDRWVPTFPNARYLFNRTEYEWWDTGAEGHATTFDTAVRPVMEAGLVELVDETYRITDEVGFELTPGHSPGHMSVRLSSAGEEAVITGDMVHHPVQFLAPHWTMSADGDAALAAQTRIGFRDRYADSPVRVFGTHFGGSSCGHLRRNGDSFRFDAFEG